MSGDSDRAHAIYSAMLEQVTSPPLDRYTSGSDESELVALLSRVSSSEAPTLEYLRVIRDTVRISSGVLTDVLGPDHARNYLEELLVLVQTAGIIDDVGSDPDREIERGDER